MSGAGDLRIRLALEQAVALPDGAGGDTLSWMHMAFVWAEMKALGGGERLAFGRTEPALSWRMSIRYRPDVRPQMRFRKDQRVFEIQAVYDPDGRRQWLDCLTVERGQ